MENIFLSFFGLLHIFSCEKNGDVVDEVVCCSDAPSATKRVDSWELIAENHPHSNHPRGWIVYRAC